jgi:uncharacterized protein YaaN involved in tellurite resistance
MNTNIGGTILTLEPEALQTQASDFSVAPTLGTIQAPQVMINGQYQAGAMNESMLTAEETQLVEQFSKEINFADTKQVLSYGASAQKSLYDFSAAVLKKVSTKDLGDIGEDLLGLTAELNMSTEVEKKGFRGLFQKAKWSADKLRANFATVEGNIDRIVKDLQKHQVALTQDVTMYDHMYELNLKYYKDLTLYIIAGKKALDNAVNTVLVQLKEKAEQSRMQEDIQAYDNFQRLCHRFERKIDDLERSRMVSLQTTPQVRLIQMNGEELLEKIQSSITNTIPLWRNQMIIALGVERSARAVRAQNAVTDQTNQLLINNSERLKMSTIEVAKASERSIVDIDTLKKCNADLITSINEVVRIHENGTKQRREAQVELVKIEEELKQALLNAGATR